MIEALMQVMLHAPGLARVMTVCPVDPRKLLADPYFQGVRVPRTGEGGQGSDGATTWVEALKGMDGDARHKAIASKTLEARADRVSGRRAGAERP